MLKKEKGVSFFVNMLNVFFCSLFHFSVFSLASISEGPSFSYARSLNCPPELMSVTTRKPLMVAPESN